MSSNHKPYDPLGEFLVQYEEYLNGLRSYDDLPACACTRPVTEIEHNYESSRHLST